MKNLWMKNKGKIGVNGMLAFVPPFLGNLYDFLKEIMYF